MPRPPRYRDDRGDTLVEVLIALTIMGILVAAVMTGFLSAAKNQSLHRSLALGETLTRSYIENVKSHSTNYASCSAVYAPVTSAGYTTAVTSKGYWVRGTKPAVFSTPCSTATGGVPAPDLQKLTVSVTDSRGAVVMTTDFSLRTTS